ncbi:hypothetical protein A5482_012740 [Cyanobacterium sp. IPPAS B-1200]|uniref:hypothetical protein n=1 Tax=Cyanobacterium sp. IPPAS B-1200 TaxID=1562720 RepID=UPI0008528124|nr:hypothetical protein [Cyanobacterium sp. IPPAS B-1200]OEJ77651.1 hypothetical protein A5482_05025 [Cyanobacterium sp. IPPAS B-1200]
MLSINLDEQTQSYLAEITIKENKTSEELLRELIYQHWQTLQPPQTLAQRRGGHPKYLLQNASPDLSLRENRKVMVKSHIKSNYDTPD